MKNHFTAATLVFSALFQLVSPTAILAQSPTRGTVDVTLEWYSGRQTYIYVFSGVVRRQGRPVPNASVQLYFNPQDQQGLLAQTVAGEDGTYQMTITIKGRPEESAIWKLYARGNELNKVAEVEGRTILSSIGETILVQRPLELVQG